MANNFSDIFTDTGSESEGSVIRKRQNKAVGPFSDVSESDSSDDKNYIQNLGDAHRSKQANLLLKTHGQNKFPLI